MEFYRVKSYTLLT